MTVLVVRQWLHADKDRLDAESTRIKEEVQYSCVRADALLTSTSRWVKRVEEKYRNKNPQAANCIVRVCSRSLWLQVQFFPHYFGGICQKWPTVRCCSLPFLPSRKLTTKTKIIMRGLWPDEFVALLNKKCTVFHSRVPRELVNFSRVNLLTRTKTLGN